MHEYEGWEVFDYIDWIKNRFLTTDRLDEDTQDYYIRLLHSVPFTFSIQMDENRYDDGINLRYRYSDECNVPAFMIDDTIDCSVFEMLAALSIRCSEDIMGENPGFWFWDWAGNVFGGFDNLDEHYILKRIYSWIGRKFDKNGFGSPFPIRKNTTSDQRKTEIWFQMLGYIHENYLGLD